MAPKYLEAFRQAAREAKSYEKSEVNEKRGQSAGLNSSNSFFSYSEPSQDSAESDAAVCAVCCATGELWHLGEALVHQECVAFLPKPEPAEPSAVYRAVSAEPDGNGCRVQIVELPQAQRYRRTFAHLQLKPQALVDVGRWRECI